jgi:hypothetical protein
VDAEFIAAYGQVERLLNRPGFHTDEVKQIGRIASVERVIPQRECDEAMAALCGKVDRTEARSELAKAEARRDQIRNDRLRRKRA